MTQRGWFYRYRGGPWTEMEVVDIRWRSIVCDVCFFGSLLRRLERSDTTIVCPRCAKKLGLKW